MEKPLGLIFGAGRIGRGFLAEIFAQAGYHCLFIEYDANTVQALEQAGRYTIYKAISQDCIQQVVIDRYRIIQSGQADAITQAVASRDPVIGVAVHQSALPDIANALAPGIRQRARSRPLEGMDIILCVNMLHPAQAMRRAFDGLLDGEALDYFQHKVGLVESVVMRMSPEATPEMKAYDPLAVLNSGYPEMPVDGKAFRGKVPQTPLLRLSDDIGAEEVRKIYTLNLAHAALCYLGVPAGYAWAADCVADAGVREILLCAMEESAAGLCAVYGFTAEEMRDWNANIVRSLENKALRDDLARLGADSVRKLGVNDRLVGPALLCKKTGRFPKALCQAIGAGFAYRQPGDPGSERVREAVENTGIRQAIMQVSGLADEEMIKEIEKAYAHYIAV